MVWMYVFFFQAEDGIRDGHVTGVQTCALPIWAGVAVKTSASAQIEKISPANPADSSMWYISEISSPRILKATCSSGLMCCTTEIGRGRVGKECRSRGAPNQSTEKKRERARLRW